MVFPNFKCKGDFQREASSHILRLISKANSKYNFYSEKNTLKVKKFMQKYKYPMGH